VQAMLPVNLLAANCHTTCAPYYDINSFVERMRSELGADRIQRLQDFKPSVDEADEPRAMVWLVPLRAHVQWANIANAYAADFLERVRVQALLLARHPFSYIPEGVQETLMTPIVPAHVQAVQEMETGESTVSAEIFGALCAIADAVV
jgi:hypothetical protein